MILRDTLSMIKIKNEVIINYASQSNNDTESIDSYRAYVFII